MILCQTRRSFTFNCEKPFGRGVQSGQTDAMRPGHAAALALVSWYLMTPPVRHGKTLYSAPARGIGITKGRLTPRTRARANIEALFREADSSKKQTQT